MEMIVPAGVFLLATALLAFAGLRLVTVRGADLDQRLQQVIGTAIVEEAPSRGGQLKAFFTHLGARAPRLSSEIGKVRQRLVEAGYRNEEALTVFYGIRFSVAIAVFALLATPVLVKPNIMFALGGCLLGYVLPGMGLARLAKRRQHAIQLSLADAVDLLVVSVEAGLGLDQALLRVGTELATTQTAPAWTTSDRWQPCSSRPTSSAPAWPRPSASTPRCCGPSAASGRRKRPPRRA
jgi:tight adherence protein C